MKLKGWKKGKETVLETDDPYKLICFACYMDTVEYIDVN